MDIAGLNSGMAILTGENDRLKKENAQLWKQMGKVDTFIRTVWRVVEEVGKWFVRPLLVTNLLPDARPLLLSWGDRHQESVLGYVGLVP